MIKIPPCLIDLIKQIDFMSRLDYMQTCNLICCKYNLLYIIAVYLSLSTATMYLAINRVWLVGEGRHVGTFERTFTINVATVMNIDEIRLSTLLASFYILASLASYIYIHDG